MLDRSGSVNVEVIIFLHHTEEGNVVSEAVVRRVIGVEGAQALISIVEGAWQDYLNEDISRYHRSTRANIVWDYMARRSDDVLGEMDGVERVERHERPLYVLRERLLLRPKLHTQDSTTRNYATRAQRGAARTGLFPEYDYDVISFGYRLDRAEAGIDTLPITSPAEAWVIDAQDLADGNLEPATPLITGIEEDLSGIEPIRRRTGS